MLRITIRDLSADADSGRRYFRATVTVGWAKRFDNGALVSCGLTVDDDLPRDTFNRLMTTGRVVAVSFDEWNHSGCQSSCTLRGDAACRW